MGRKKSKRKRKKDKDKEKVVMQPEDCTIRETEPQESYKGLIAKKLYSMMESPRSTSVADGSGGNTNPFVNEAEAEAVGDTNPFVKEKEKEKEKVSTNPFASEDAGDVVEKSNESGLAETNPFAQSKKSAATNPFFTDDGDLP